MFISRGISFLCSFIARFILNKFHPCNHDIWNAKIAHRLKKKINHVIFHQFNNKF